MPDMYAAGSYDLAGFCVGIVERAEMIDGSTIAAGDALLGLASSGPHSNGYSLIRKVLARDPHAEIDGRSVSDALLEPTRIYVRPVLDLLTKVRARGLAHITGGGISENLPRVIPPQLHAEIDTSSWQQGPVFDWLASTGNIASNEMRRTFNCGVGMVVVVAAADVDSALAALRASGENAWHLGQIAAGSGEVQYL
jgi:phosphoribosylformylglycinamidine cyclo-ligase